MGRVDLLGYYDSWVSNMMDLQSRTYYPWGDQEASSLTKLAFMASKTIPTLLFTFIF
ncbi:hypothetical protein CLV98_101661 [Dyadobacter jejuensis]|uniref:Uncharacterized protein n=1 Tax=Dyadobacter jejuensis TaxID=1082580 RepID=A0A316BDB3_9BACT|nr:hypothetical protein CLV98_101661 [Dyadobacter jejuensis]